MKNFLSFSVLFLLVSNLISCAAALVPETNDPQVKINQGYQLVQLGRSLAARKVMEQAVAMYTEKNDLLGQAKAHMALADLYRVGRTHGDLKLPDLMLSATEQEKAAGNYSQAGYKMHYSMLLWLAGDSFGKAGDKVKACALLKQSMTSFEPQAKDIEGLINPDQLPVRVKMSQKDFACK